MNQPACLFCNLPPERVLLETETTLAFFDGYPVTEGHVLVIPKRHVASVFDLPSDELAALWTQVGAVRKLLADKYSPDAFNIGVNDGAAAGQRILLTPVRPLLRDLQQDKCFYCGERLTGQKVEVDHFIPWSRYPVDLGHNFVLADERCNRNKSDTLAATAHLEHWLDQIQRSPVELDSAFAELMIPMNRGRSVRIANWAYSRDYERKAMMWLRATEMLRLDEGWNRALAALLN